MAEPDRRSVRAAVLGSPIGHSLSPVLHNAAYADLGLTWWHYSAIECDEAGLPGFLDSCGPDWAGLSLTMPLKRAVLPLLDRVDPLARQVGGANTVLFTADSRLGYNTDVAGMIRALAEHGIGEGPGTGIGPALILGAGATACSALAALAGLGEEIAIVAVRDPARRGDLLEAAERIGVKVETRPFEPASAAGVELIISTVPAAAADPFAEVFSREDAAAPAREGWRALPAIFDVVYHPWPTGLAVAAAAAGAVVVSGFDLMLHQAAGQVELLTGRPAPVEVMRAAGLAELADRAR